MATDQEKLTNRARMWGLTVQAMTLGIWDMVEESSVSLSPVIGEMLLKMAEKQLGLELAGEKPDHIMVELGRIFADEFGYCSEVNVEQKDKTIIATLRNAVGVAEYHLLAEHGVTKPFSNPFYCTGLAALKRLGIKARGDMRVDPAAKGFVVTFEML